jgi:hypothetical protein
MSRLKDAVHAVEAELLQAREGLTYYAHRVAALEQALRQIDGVDAEPSTARQTSGKAKVQRQAAAEAKHGTNSHARSKGAGGELPSTGGDFWLRLISNNKISAPEILATAVDRLDFTPSKEQIKKLSSRMTMALNALVNAHKIKDSGRGRARRYFK